jgi:hypothetical protein
MFPHKSGTIEIMSCGIAVPNMLKISTIHADAKAQISLSAQNNNVNYLCDLIAYSNILFWKTLDLATYFHSIHGGFQMTSQVEVQRCQVCGSWWPFHKSPSSNALLREVFIHLFSHCTADILIAWCSRHLGYSVEYWDGIVHCSTTARYKHVSQRRPRLYKSKRFHEIDTRFVATDETDNNRRIFGVVFSLRFAPNYKREFIHEFVDSFVRVVDSFNQRTKEAEEVTDS